MKKREILPALVAALLLAISCTVFGEIPEIPAELRPPDWETVGGQTAAAAEMPVPWEGEISFPWTAETPVPGAAEIPALGEDSPAELPLLRMTVDKSTGAMEITRSKPAGGAEGDAVVWTIFVYLCGSDLETEDGYATDDVLEMLDAVTGNRVRFVLQTGGTQEWMNNTVEADKLQRYLVRSGELWLEDEAEPAGMGQADTLADFLDWGLLNFASEHMGLVFWDHGGGSITGVCFDEQDDYDSVSLRELEEALSRACGRAGRSFDFIGFDACLMGTLETANILASYADFMYASQELEPAGGWDYAALGSYLALHPDAGGVALGRALCSSYMKSCRNSGDEESSTFSAVDLGKLDPLLRSFNDFAAGMYAAGEDPTALADMVRGIRKADNFGGNNRAEGYTNMVDLGGLISACAAQVPAAGDALAALEDAVCCTVSGTLHPKASGLSIYYPLSVQGSEELAVFGGICVSPYYLSFVDRQCYSGYFGVTGYYDEDQWFDASGVWSWQNMPEEYGYWDYLEDMALTGESPWITFDVEPHQDREGDFWFALDSEGLYYAADVYGVVYEYSEDGEDVIELGETCDIVAEWESGMFIDDFDGRWLSLPDGQNLALYILDVTEKAIRYTSPVLLNGRETNLRLCQNLDDGSVTIEGAWDGLEEYGAAAREELVELRAGDELIPVYYAYSLESDEESCYYGKGYVYRTGAEITYDRMERGDYLYSFCIDDIYGDCYLTDSVMFTVEWDGSVYYHAN